MKTTKKIFIILLSVILCVSLAACLPQTEEETDSASNTDSLVQEAGTDESEAEVDTDETYEDVVLDCRVELSGDPKETFVAEQDCYTDSDRVIIFFPEGVEVNGDMLKVTEEIKSDLCRQSGLNFKKNYNYETFNVIGMYFENTELSTVDPANKKIHILIVDPNEELCNWAFEGGIVVSTDSYDYDKTHYQVLYHELSHVIHTRNGTSLTPLMSEGYAVFMSYHTMRANGIPSEETHQYFSSPEYPSGRFDDSIIQNGEEAFMIPYGKRVDIYHYGFRLITFLNDVYGEDTFEKILKEATDRGFDEGFSDENEKEDIKQDQLEMIEIIKSQTSDDVFEEFAEWYELNWDKLYEDYLDYMEKTDQ